MKKQTILVTAASGSAGRNIVEALLDKQFDVVATSRGPSNLRFSQPVEGRAYDANLPADFEVLLGSIDAVVLVGPPLDGRVHEKLAPLIAAVARKASSTWFICPAITCRGSQAKRSKTSRSGRWSD